MRIAAKNAPKIRAAIKQSFDAQAIYEAYLATMPNPDEKLPMARVKARSWAIMNINFDRQPLGVVLRRVLADGYVLGIVSANEALFRARKKLKKKALEVDGFIDWENWKPGSESAALLLRPTGSFKKMLDDLDISIKDINTTDYDKLGSALADSVALGLTPKRGAKLLQNVVASPARALTIAVTEQARAITTASIERYRESGVEEVEWIAAIPCDICEVNEGEVRPVGSAFTSGDTQPPVHPNCRCALLPLVSELADEGGGRFGAPNDTSGLVTEETVAQALLDYEEIQTYQQKVNPEFRLGGNAIPQEYQNALEAYKTEGYERINNILRDPFGEREAYTGFEFDETMGIVNQIDLAMGAAPALPQELISYRGVRGQVAVRFKEIGRASCRERV
jgi:SPP1 gp7 family putative phage head morphogenesis protein